MRCFSMIMGMIVSILLLNGCRTMPSHSSQSVVHVALFADKGTLAKCNDKTMEILSQQKGITIQKIKQADILKDKLQGIDVILFPGGGGGDEARSLGKEGCQIVTEFVKQGHGIIGTCAGAYLLGKGWNESTRQIELINSEVNDLDNWARGVQPVECYITGASKSLQGRVFKIFYENGPPLVPSDLHQLPDYVSLAKFKTDLHAKSAPAGMMGDKDAIIASRYGKGRVLLFSPHPELTPGLEPLLVRAVKWVAIPAKPNERITWETVFGKDVIQ